MKIKRNVNGQDIEFELTGEEIYQVYFEQDRKFHQEDIEMVLEEDGLNVSVRQLQAIIEQYEDNLCCDGGWRDSAYAAIYAVINETK